MGLNVTISSPPIVFDLNSERYHIYAITKVVTMTSFESDEKQCLRQLNLNSECINS